jgi:hypothetical protein
VWVFPHFALSLVGTDDGRESNHILAADQVSTALEVVMQFTEWPEAPGTYDGYDGVHMCIAIAITAQQASALRGTGTVRYTQDGNPVAILVERNLED